MDCGPIPNSFDAMAFRPIFPFTLSSHRLLDLYELGHELSKGSSGVVRLCRCLLSGESFTCKTILKKDLRNIEDISYVRKEVELMSHLSQHQLASSDSQTTTQFVHRNVVRLHQVLEDEDKVHLIMEFFRGGDLFERLKKKCKFLESKVVRVIKNLMIAVQWCHALGIMHHDIKLENILLIDENLDSCDIRLIDFSLSEVFEAGDTFIVSVGTRYYITPEMIQRRPSYSQQVDVWSSDVVLYMLLSGEPPFWGPTNQSICNSIIHNQLSFLEKSWMGISSSCKNLIREMICRDPEMRMTCTGRSLSISLDPAGPDGPITSYKQICNRCCIQAAGIDGRR